MYKKILSYRPNFRPSLVFLLIPILISFIFIAKSFDQYSERENGESKNQELENNFSELEKKILILQKNYKNLSEKFSELNIEHEDLKKKYDEERKKSQVLAEEQKNIKLYSAISGNPEHNRLMKNHINRLVKEIDFCIAQLQNSGL